MSFVHSYWLYLIPLVLVLGLLAFYYSARVKKNYMQVFASRRLLEELLLSYSPAKTRIKNALIIVAVICAVVALARPQWGYSWKEVHGKGIDILFALDTSKSMLAEDLKPNRLEKAKFSILDFISSLQGDRVGLVAFAGSAFLQCPLTLDYDAFRQTLEAIDTNAVGSAGTDLASAISETIETFSEDNNFKILILITDGEDLEASGILAAKEAHDKHGLTIYTVGVGTSRGELIPLRSDRGQVSYLKDASGRPVKTRLDEDTLGKIAQAAGGFYVPLGKTGQGLEEIYRNGLERIPKEDLHTRLQQVPLEKYYWPLIAAILLLIVEMLMSKRKRRGFLRRLQANLVLFFLLGMCATHSLSASVDQAKQWYDQGDYARAAKNYEQALEGSEDKASLYYNLGASLYRVEDYQESLDAFEEALVLADVSLQQDIFYNLGNTSYRLGESMLREAPQETITAWEKGLEHYENALELNPKDDEAQDNYDLLKERLEELKKKEQQEQSSQRQQKKQQQQEKDRQRESQQQTQQGSERGESKNSQSSSSPNSKSAEKEGQRGEKSPRQSDSGDEPQKSSGKENEEHTGSQQDQGSSQGRQLKENGVSGSDSTKETLGSGNEAAYGRVMTKREAAQLLDSLKQSEKKLPAMGWGNTRKDEAHKKNW